MQNSQKPLLLSFSRNDIKIILFCLTIACTFWIFKALNKTYITQIKYPIHVTYDKDKMVQMSPMTQKYIRLNVSSYGWTLVRRGFLSKIAPFELKISSIPTDNELIATSFLPIITEQLKEIKISNIENDTLKLNLAYLQEKKVKVIVDSANVSLSGGFKINSAIEIEPKELIFKGPASSLSAIADTLHIQIQAKNIDANHDETIKIHQTNKFVQVDNSKISVHFDVVSIK